MVEVSIPVPANFALFENYPNPFNPTTHIKFQLPELNKVSITIYDTQGKVVNNLVENVEYNPGEHVTS